MVGEYLGQIIDRNWKQNAKQDEYASFESVRIFLQMCNNYMCVGKCIQNMIAKLNLGLRFTLGIRNDVNYIIGFQFSRQLPDWMFSLCFPLSPYHWTNYSCGLRSTSHTINV